MSLLYNHQDPYLGYTMGDITGCQHVLQLKRRCVELRDVQHIQDASMNWSCERVKDEGAVQQDYAERHAPETVF